MNVAETVETPAAALERALAEIPDPALALRVRLACVACTAAVRDQERAAAADGTAAVARANARLQARVHELDEHLAVLDARFVFVRRIAEAHHGGEPSHRWLHALLIDIPAYIDAARATPPGGKGGRDG